MTLVKLRAGADQGRQGAEKAELDALTHRRQNGRLSALWPPGILISFLELGESPT